VKFKTSSNTHVVWRLCADIHDTEIQIENFDTAVHGYIRQPNSY